MTDLVNTSIHPRLGVLFVLVSHVVLIGCNAGGTAPGAEQSASGPSCPSGVQQPVAGGAGLHTSLECVKCLARAVPEFENANACADYWYCYCGCDPTRSDCLRGCQRKVDEPCASWWSSVLYVAQHTCQSPEGASGCEQQCIGQSFPVNDAGLAGIEDALGFGMEVYAPPVVCDAGKGGQ